MKIKASSVPDEGLDCAYTYEPRLLDLETEDLKFKRPIAAQYHIEKIQGEFLVNVRVDTVMDITCVRCLENMEYLFKKEYAFSYKAKDTDVVDTTDDLREEIILDYPIKPLCRQDCLGLCPGCGENLNKGKCRCKGNTDNKLLTL